MAARPHHGAIRRRTLDGLGVSPNSINARLADHRLRRTATWGVYVVSALADAWTPLVITLARCDCLAASHEWAAATYHWDGFDRAPSIPPTAVCPWTTRPTFRPFRRRDLSRRDLCLVRGIRVPRAAWTLATLSESRHVAPDRLEWAVESALREGHATEHGLRTCVDALSPNPAAAALGALLDLRGPDTPATGSLLETLTVQRVLRRHGIAVVARQVDVYAQGRFVGRPDFLLEGWTILEVDGSQHANVDHARADRARDLRMRSLGLEVVRVGDTDIDADGVLATRLKQVIRHRLATRPEPPPLRRGALHFGDSSPH
jgi:very-short-patch-repair endonuclease